MVVELFNEGGGLLSFVRINLLPTKTLKTPLDAVVEPDGDGYIARTVDLPLYGVWRRPD